MAHHASGLDQYTQLTRAVFLAGVLDVRAIEAAIDRVGGTDLDHGTTDRFWWVKWKGHEVSLHFPSSSVEEILHVIPLDVPHEVRSVLTVNINDPEAEALAWHLVCSLLTHAASWYDGDQMLTMTPTGPTAIDLDKNLQHPMPLWHTVQIALGSVAPLSIDALAAALDDTALEQGWSEITGDQYRLQLRLTETSDLPAELSDVLARSGRDAQFWLVILAHGPHAYAVAAEVARRLAKAEGTSLTWIDHGGNTGVVSAEEVIFDDTPLPDALMYLKEFASEWDLANLLVPVGAERVADEEGRSSWVVPTEGGQVKVTLERDGVVGQMNSSGVTAWLSRFGGKAGSIVVFQCGDGVTLETAQPVAEVISQSYENYWLPRGASTDEARRS